MRFTPAAIAAAILLATYSTASMGSAAQRSIDPASAMLVAEGEQAYSEGRLAEASGLFESALAVDPANDRAFVDLGRVAEAENRFGAAIRYYREALALDPGNRQAIAGEGAALAARGATDRAKAVLAKLRPMCEGPCDEVVRLEAALARGPQREAVVAQAEIEAAQDAAEEASQD